ncbi:iron complex outermembrane recepter protein [bacterium A37T11]|nr:iron complex outermembrane recepter protein [bacterium A37T11]
MKAKFIFFIVVCISTYVTAVAQVKGKINGQLTTSDGHPAVDITVTLTNSNKKIKSNDQGRYSFEKLDPGAYTIKITAVGINTQTKSITITNGEEAQLDFTLSESSQVLDDVVVRANKKKYNTDVPSKTLRINEPLIEAPQNIQVITNQTFKDQQITSLSDGLIANISGATRMEHWGDIYTRVNARGSRLAAFRNGFNVTSTWGPLTEDMSFVERVEFVKGPAGFMMSNGEPSGIYNVVTKKPTGKDFNGEASISTGSYDFYRATLDLDGKATTNGKLLYRVNLMGQLKNSFRDNEFNNRFSIAPVLTYKFSDQTSLTAEYTYQGVKMSDIGSYYTFATEGYAILPKKATPIDDQMPDTRVHDHSAFLTFQHEFSDKWKLTAQTAYFNFYQIGSDMWPAKVLDGGLIQRAISGWEGRSEQYFGQLYINGDVTTGAVRHRIIAGIDYGHKNYLADWNQYHVLDSEDHLFDEGNLSYQAPANGYPNFDFTTTSLKERDATAGYYNQRYTGIYLQDELGFLENKLRLTIAGRYTFLRQPSEEDPLKKNKFTPRFGLSYSFDDNTSAYALYDQTFTPQSGVRRDGGEVKPISGNNYELGLKRNWFEGRLSTTLSAYRILKNDATASDPSNAATESFVINIGQTTTKGIEFDAQGELAKGLSLNVNYAYTDSKITEAASNAEATLGNVVPGYAKHTANAWLSYSLPENWINGLGVNLGANYMADRTTWAWQGTTGQLPLPTYFKMNAGLFWENNRIRITGTINNLLDKYLYSGAGYGTYYYWQTEAPRNFRASISYRF